MSKTIYTFTVDNVVKVPEKQKKNTKIKMEMKKRELLQKKSKKTYLLK